MTVLILACDGLVAGEKYSVDVPVKVISAFTREYEVVKW